MKILWFFFFSSGYIGILRFIGRVNGNLGGPRPLRPGPRINLAGRARPGQATSTTTAAPEGENEAPAEETAAAEGEEKVCK